VQEENSQQETYIQKAFTSSYDGSVKFVVRLADGYSVEMVLMPEKTRTTLCLSSQVGCKRGCRFCNTARLKLVRGLSSAELAGQVSLAQAWMDEETSERRQWHEKWRVVPSVGNLVFMGMGEPLDNFDNLIEFLPVAMDQRGMSIPQKNICVSTVGRMDRLHQLHQKYPRVPVAISLHAGDSTLRKKLMPIESEFSSQQIAEFIHMRMLAHRRDPRVLLQVLLMEGVNNRRKHANELVEFIRSANLPGEMIKKVKINLIPFNAFDESSFREPREESIQMFRDVLIGAGMRALIRYSKGQDIAGACGQLALK